MKFVVFFLFFKYLYALDHENDRSDLIDYYEHLITIEINNTHFYKLPTSGKEFKPTNNFLLEDFGDFDFIVVGSGPGGAVVANRLSEIKEWNILLIEAGGPETNFSIIPAMQLYLWDSRFNWNYESIPQSKSCLGMRENRCSIPRGKCMGGSSSINAILYSRGHKHDYDRWAKEGNPGWSYQDVLPYFIKSENSQVNGDPGYHGRDGYWNIRNQRFPSEQATAYVAGSKIAYPSSSEDYNGMEECGVFNCQLHSIKQFRHSASKAFLEPIIHRPNLKIVTYSYVTKVSINPLTLTATGVEFTRNGKTYFANARKEVIVSGGAINSPQLLMLSGIGPKNHLFKMNIPVVKDLPVGRNLFNHPTFYGAYVSTNSSIRVIPLRESIKQFLNEYGTLAVALNSQAIAFYQSKFERTPKYPDIEIIVSPANGPRNYTKHFLKLKDDVYEALFRNMNFQTTMGIYLIVLRSRSAGTITLRSNDPYRYPKIDTQFLNNDKDVEIMYEGIQTLKRIVETEPMRKINASLVLADYLQCRGYERGSKDYWICALRLLTGSLYHDMSTCRMGPDPKYSVVDSRAKVHGVTGLRVVDASVLPFPLSGHPTAPTVMVAEKVSDYIKLDHGIEIDFITNVID